MPPKNTLITGLPGSGKTTLVEKIVAELNVPAVGFITREIRERGHRVGFSIDTLADQIDYLKEVEQCAGQLEQRFQSTIDDYQRLGDAFIQLQEYAASIAGERDQLQDQLSVVIEYFMKLHADFKKLTI